MPGARTAALSRLPHVARSPVQARPAAPLVAQVCKEREARYKCPGCGCQTCSAPCVKQHKVVCCWLTCRDRMLHPELTAAPPRRPMHSAMAAGGKPSAGIETSTSSTRTPCILVSTVAHAFVTFIRRPLAQRACLAGLIGGQRPPGRPVSSAAERNAPQWHAAAAGSADPGPRRVRHAHRCRVVYNTAPSCDTAATVREQTTSSSRRASEASTSLRASSSSWAGTGPSRSTTSSSS